MAINNQRVKTDSKIFLKMLWKYFANSGSTLCYNILLNAANHLLKIYNKSCLSSFGVHEILNDEVSAYIDLSQTFRHNKIDAGQNRPWSKSALVKICTCQNRHWSKSAHVRIGTEKKNELTLLYSA